MDGVVNGYFLGAYATSPSLNGWDPDQETRYYDELKALPNLRGLEIPFYGSLHAHSEQWLLNSLAPSWDVVLTLIPGTMVNVGRNSEHGLASKSASGRREAIAFARSAHEAVRRLNRHAGRARVVAVEIHSAPRRQSANDLRSSVDAFVESLIELTSWDWDGAQLCVEHCDAWRPGHAPFKGFMDIELEIEAILRANARSGANAGVAINWGRSVLESRDPNTALEHIAQASNAGVLAGLIFSGCSGEDTPWGVWDDTHMPHAPSEGLDHAAPGSLMTEQAIGDALHVANVANLAFLGAKITAFPATADLSKRVGLNECLLRLLSRCQTRLNSL